MEDVKLRERLSSTAVTEFLAMPHAMSAYPAQSFICVAHRASPFPWGTKLVREALLIGLTKKDMPYFSEALEVIIDRLLDLDQAMGVLGASDFDSFVSALLGDEA